MKRSNLIIFATYWNEIDWIKASLRQIEELNPKEVIICDGCFDETKANYSTDGTRKVILDWASKRNNVTLISATRVSRWRALMKIASGHKKGRWFYLFTFCRAKALLLSIFLNKYRINQALTFQRMISLSKCWEPGVWTMNVDCDQFYSDTMLNSIKTLTELNSNLSLLEGNELTFFKNFKECTREYEKRTYNNMPHKILKNTSFIPTRGTVLEDLNLKSLNPKDFFINDYYIKRVSSANIGEYFHYKFKFNKKRLSAGYQLGDRKKPDISKYKGEKFYGKHPEIVNELMINENCTL